MDRFRDKTEISIKDLTAVLLSKTVLIFICVILIGAIGLGYVMVIGRDIKARVPTDEEIATARELLSPTDAGTVDRVYAQYVSYSQYKESLQKYFDNFLFTEDDTENYIQMTTIRG